MLLVAMSFIAKRRNIDPPPNPPQAGDTGRISKTAIDIKFVFLLKFFKRLPRHHAIPRWRGQGVD